MKKFIPLFLMMALFGCVATRLPEVKLKAWDNTIRIRTQVVFGLVNNTYFCETYSVDQFYVELYQAEEAFKAAGLPLKFEVVEEYYTTEHWLLDVAYSKAWAGLTPDRMTIFIVPHAISIQGISSFPDDDLPHGLMLFGPYHRKYVLAHEIGHIFFLRHTFEDFPTNASGDFHMADPNIMGYGFNPKEFTKEQMAIVEENLKHENRRRYIMK